MFRCASGLRFRDGLLPGVLDEYRLGEYRYMDSGQATSSGGERGRQEPVLIGNASAKGRATGRSRASDRHQSAAASREAADPAIDPAMIDAAGDGMERTAAVLSGAGKDVATAQDRMSLVGELPELPADRYLDREESWLRFAQRVL